MSPHSTSAPCPLCHRLALAKAESPLFIFEFQHSLVYLGDHQFYPGYCVLFFKRHVREMHDLDPMEQAGFLKDVMRVGKAISEEFKPWKINYASLGNVEPHLHWHVFPRYESDVNHRNHPWSNSTSFDQWSSAKQPVEDTIERLRRRLEQWGS